MAMYLKRRLASLERAAAESGAAAGMCRCFKGPGVVVIDGDGPRPPQAPCSRGGRERELVEVRFVDTLPEHVPRRPPVDPSLPTMADLFTLGASTKREDQTRWPNEPADEPGLRG